MQRTRLKIKNVKDSDSTKHTRIKLKMHRKAKNFAKREEHSQMLAVKETNAALGLNKSGNRTGMANSDPEKMRKVRALRRFYGKKMPNMQCSNCKFSATCPQYKAGYECAFTPMLKSHRIESEEDLVDYMRELVGANMRRAHQGLIMETLAGGDPSLETSEALNLAFGQLTKLFDLQRDADSVDVEIESNDSSIIGRVFGGLDELVDETEQAKVLEESDYDLRLEDSDNESIVKDDFQNDLAMEFQQIQSTRSTEQVHKLKEIKVS